MVGNKDWQDLCRRMPAFKTTRRLVRTSRELQRVELCHAGRAERIECEHAGDDQANLPRFSTCGKVGAEHKASTEQTEHDSPAEDNPVRTGLVNDGLALAEVPLRDLLRRVYEVQGS
jgi:hypothetical protein